MVGVIQTDHWRSFEVIEAPALRGKGEDGREIWLRQVKPLFYFAAPIAAVYALRRDLEEVLVSYARRFVPLWEVAEHRRESPREMPAATGSSKVTEEGVPNSAIVNMENGLVGVKEYD